MKINKVIDLDILILSREGERTPHHTHINKYSEDRRKNPWSDFNKYVQPMQLGKLIDDQYH